MSQKLFEDFKKYSKSEWVDKASKDLKGENPIEKFKWEIEEGLEVLPYYDQEDVKSFENTFNNRIFKDDHPTGEQRHWDNLQAIHVKEEGASNDLALQALSSGADGLIFKLPKSSANFNKLLKEIQFEYCQTWFEVSTMDQINSLKDFFGDNKVHGGVFCDKEMFKSAYEIFCEPKGLKIGLINRYEEDQSFTEKISEALVAANSVFNQTGQNIENLTQSFAIRYPLGTDFFGEIASLKTLRRLFYQIAQAYEVTSFKPENLHIHAVSPAWQTENFDPHGNMLKGTTAAMAGIIGGCDSLYVEPEDVENKMMSRVARNVPNILKEESYFTSNVDPSAGSYYIESLEENMAKIAWSKFQKKTLN